MPTTRKAKEITQAEWRQLVNRLARHYFGMSAEEFETALKNGKLDEDRPEVMRVATLLPNGR